ncbi:hypothetical protein AK830_g3366 [Neonectria ditissima]|uniref:DNA/RNA-binding domain-containing protein n=1 Tax=Neonectria ditissima TaxID=78410 RepID=A0A0P7BC42_9HYPO|nr:hypothetical protein AK830_g3366 [Neonectria ditissima]
MDFTKKWVTHLPISDFTKKWVTHLGKEAPDESNITENVTPQPETRPISQDQLVAEVKSIYAGLVMVETKCIEVDNTQSPNKLNNEQWQALIALHRTLLHEHHDFFLASQHPSASAPPRRLASKYSMPARMWRHGIHSFLESPRSPLEYSMPTRMWRHGIHSSLERLRFPSKYAMPARMWSPGIHSFLEASRLAFEFADPPRMWRHGIHSFLELLPPWLPASLEFMLTFIYLAYTMMALLYETVSTFEDTWIECLGDLGRYRMAIEDDDIRDRKVSAGVTRHWYSKAAGKPPSTGRLYHHLAILARPNPLQQLFYHVKSLCAAIPLLGTRETFALSSAFNSISASFHGWSSVDSTFLPRRRAMSLFDSNYKLKTRGDFLASLGKQIGRTTKRWVASCITASRVVGVNSSINMRTNTQRKPSTDTTIALKTGINPGPSPAAMLSRVVPFAFQTHEKTMNRWGNLNTLPFVHAFLVFFHYIAQYANALSYVNCQFPWTSIVFVLNYLQQSTTKIRKDENFPHVDDCLPRPLPEDYAMRGLVYSEQYFPVGWFDDGSVPEDENPCELISLERDLTVLEYPSATKRTKKRRRPTSIFTQYDLWDTMLFLGNGHD